MLALLCAKSSAIAQQRESRSSTRLAAAFGVVTLGLFAAACVATPPKSYIGSDPSDPSVRVPSAEYRSAIGGYTGQRPVEPAPWREQNERVTPVPRR
jgi:hypothetical protein